MPENHKYVNFWCDFQPQGKLEGLFWQAKKA
jgi:hypothetical protein